MTLARRAASLMAGLLMALSGTFALANPVATAPVKGVVGLEQAMKRPHSCTALVNGTRATVVCSFQNGAPERFNVPSAWVRRRMTRVPGTGGLFQDGNAG